MILNWTLKKPSRFTIYNLECYIYLSLLILWMSEIRKRWNIRQSLSQVSTFITQSLLRLTICSSEVKKPQSLLLKSLIGGNALVLYVSLFLLHGVCFNLRKTNWYVPWWEFTVDFKILYMIFFLQLIDVFTGTVSSTIFWLQCACLYRVLQFAQTVTIKALMCTYFENL